MPGKSTFFDYEPLTRKVDTNQAEEEFKFGVTPHSNPTPDHIVEGPASVSNGQVRKTHFENVRTAEATEQLSSQMNRTRRLLRRGHTITFIGLFLFTFLVFARPYELFPSLSWLSSSTFWVAIFTLIVFVPIQLGLENRITIRPLEVNLVLVLLITSLVSIGFALDRVRAWNSFVDYLKVVMMFIVLLNVVGTDKRLKRLWLLVLIISCVIALAAINDYRLDRLMLQGKRIKGIVGGLFENPNDLALHFVTMIPIAFALVFGSSGVLRKIFYLLCAAIMIAGVVVTFSRGGFIGLIIAVGYFLWRLARRHRVVIAVLGAGTLFLLIVFSPGGYGGRVSTTSDDSVRARVDDLKRSVYVAAHHPVVGVGIDNYVLYSNSNHATHNAYTQVAAEIGFPAMLVYLVFLINPLRRLRKMVDNGYTMSATNQLHYLYVGVEASLVGYMVTSFFASVAYLWYVYYLVAYAICLRRLGDAADVDVVAQSSRV